MINLVRGPRTSRIFASCLGSALRAAAFVPAALAEDLAEARAHQKIYLDALEKQHARRHAAAGVVSLAAYRKARR